MSSFIALTVIAFLSASRLQAHFSLRAQSKLYQWITSSKRRTFAISLSDIMLNLVEQEKRILVFWEKKNIFQKSLEARKGQPPFVFYEGPPTANGKPGLHHVLARAYKDIILRYKTMQGFFVPRKAGWDTHGLPVEIEVEKELGINSKKGIEEYGVGAFIKKAKESVWRYKQDWEFLTKRMGFWLDLDHPYITYETKYIESLWFIIASFWKKKLLMEDFKVVPWCYRCGTPLSSHELAQGYKKVTDTSVFVKFKVQNEKFKAAVKNSKLENLLINKERPVYILSWTTTPWTLPGNVALAVGRNITYVIVKPQEVDERYILAEERLPLIKDYEVIAKVKGKDLVNLFYEPLFDVPQLKSEKSYKIYAADFVSTDEGTGVVHTAVMYGEDDYRLGKKIGLPMVHTVREDGTFVEGIGHGLGGLHVKAKETEEIIANHLRKKNLLFASENYSHDYPFCWRCKNPLLYYATKAWFVKVSKVKKSLLANNKTINWIPEHLKHGRFGNFLQEGKDWAFSRERYWGTPLPIWQCLHCHYTEVLGGIAELSKRVKPRNTFILVRHGQSENNLTHTLSSMPEQKEYALSQKGKSQAQCLGELLLPEHIDYIISSPLARTAQTATIISKITGALVEFDERLREVDFGSFNGKSLEAYEAFWASKEAKFRRSGGDGMENFHDLKVRLFECLSDINKKYERKTILIVTHKGPLWVLEGTLRGLSEQEIAHTFPEDFESGEARKVMVTLPFNDEGEIDLHRPFIDELTLSCETCKGSMKRIAAVADVWFDSGAMPFAQGHWPFAFAQVQSSKFKVQNLGKLAFPADYICEAIDQTRGWFYTLLAVSTLLGYNAPYKNAISLGHLLDEKGRKMSKSLGNIIDPLEAINEFGVDTLRWYFYIVNPPGFYKRFDRKEILSHQRRFLFTLFNSANFFNIHGNKNNEVKEEYDKLSQKLPEHTLDQWILSRLQGTIADVTKRLEAFDVTQAARALESFVDDLSNWYIRLSRQRIQRNNRHQVAAVLLAVLLDLTKLIAPFVPFSADSIWGDEYLNKYHWILEGKESSVHLTDWPKVNKKFINKTLEEQMHQARKDVMLALADRAQHNIKVRQPLASLKTKYDHPSQIKELIAQEVNVEKVITDRSLADDIELNTTIDEKLLRKGFIREFWRQTQDLRKQAGLILGQQVELAVSAPSDIRNLLEQEQQRLESELSIRITFVDNWHELPYQKKLNSDDKEITIGIDA